MSRTPLAIVAAVALVAAAGVGVYLIADSDDDGRSTTTTTEARPEDTTTSTSATDSCTSEVGGYSVEYPAGWYVDDSNPAWACGLFDPEPYVVEPETEFPVVAVTIDVEPGVSYADIVAGNTDPSTWEVLDRRDTTVDGFPAVVLEAVQTTELLLPAGTYWYQVAIDRPGAATIAYTTGEPGPAYDDNRATLDAMVASLRFTG